MNTIAKANDPFNNEPITIEEAKSFLSLSSLFVELMKSKYSIKEEEERKEDE